MDDMPFPTKPYSIVYPSGDDYLCFKILKNNKLSLPPNCLHSGPVPVKAQDHYLPHLGQLHDKAVPHYQIFWLDRA